MIIQLKQEKKRDISMFCIRVSEGRRIYYTHKSLLPYMPNKSKPTIALTGATGFLGSHLMASLLTKGYNVVVFGRPVKNESLNERVTMLLKWFGMVNFSGQVTCIDADLSQENMEIEKGEY